MSKRDRAAREKEAAEGSAADSAAAELDAAAGGEGADEQSTGAAKELRPSGKRSARGRRSSTVSGTDGDADSGKGSVAVKDRKKKKASAEESRNPLVRDLGVPHAGRRRAEEGHAADALREMITYTIVVLVFVIVMTAFIAGLDLAFAKGVLWLFG